jgi:hypothetical protein
MVSLAVRRVDPRPPPTWPQTPPAGPEICGPRVYLEPVPVSPATTRTPHPRARSSDRLQHVTPPAATSRHESAASIARATAHVPAHVGAFGFPSLARPLGLLGSLRSRVPPLAARWRPPHDAPPGAHERLPSSSQHGASPPTGHRGRLARCSLSLSSPLCLGTRGSAGRMLTHSQRHPLVSGPASRPGADR